MKNNSTKEFLKQVRLAFPVFQKNEKRFYKDFEFSVEAYTEQQPSFTTEDLCGYFGHPKDIVTTYFDNMESGVYFAMMRRARYIKGMMISIIVFLCLALTVTFGFWMDAKIQFKEDTINSLETTIEDHGIHEEN